MTVRYLDLDGQEQTLRAEGLWRCASNTNSTTSRARSSWDHLSQLKQTRIRTRWPSSRGSLPEAGSQRVYGFAALLARSRIARGASCRLGCTASRYDPSMKIILRVFSEFAACALEALAGAGHEIALVLTSLTGRPACGMALTPSPVKRLALTQGISVFQPATLRDSDAQARIAAVGADVMVVAAYGLILPLRRSSTCPASAASISTLPSCPAGEGAAPIQRAILAGDQESGVCIMQMEAGLDTGPVLPAGAMPIAPTDSAGTLHDRFGRPGSGI